MAKGSLIGVKRGKVGNMVAYNITNSNNKEKQGWREYQPVVRNPQSDGQMSQRVKMAAVTNLYRDLKSVITRGLENKAYGNESRKAWMSMALGANFDGPWLVKGDTQAPPINGVPISVGSLVPVFTAYVQGQNVQPLLPGTPGDYPGEDPGTIGLLSQYFKVAGYKDGDQVTFVTGWVPMRLAFSWDVKSFIIDESDNRSTEDVLRLNFAPGSTVIDNVDYVTLGVLPISHNIDTIAVIISRDGETVHLRSTANFAWNPSGALAAWYSQRAYENAKASYISQSAASLDWPVEPGSDVEGASSAAMLNSDPAVQVTVGAMGALDGYATVYDETNGTTRFIYNEDSQSSKYHAWLLATKSGVVWSNTAPSGATAAAAIRFVGGSSANASDVAFAQWLEAQGYNARALYGLV